eukprot:2619870-Pyramimonas_sp.AAC.1
MELRASCPRSDRQSEGAVQGKGAPIARLPAGDPMIKLGNRQSGSLLPLAAQWECGATATMAIGGAE